MNVGDTMPLRVQLLGPVRAWMEERDVNLGTPRRRAVFAMLAMQPNRVVSRQELVDGIWGSGPPASVVNGIHIYVAGLRRELEPGRGRQTPGQVLRTSGAGYLLQLEPGQPDAAALAQHLAQARAARAADDLASAARSLEAASALWQAAPLCGIPGPWAETERVRLTELWLTVIEESTEVMLARGGHAEVAAGLAKLVRDYPLREKFAGQLMLARYRCGRQADALAVFAETRRILVTELGIEPSPELQRLHERVLAADDALLLPVVSEDQ
jgi:DNA-binding SARP family transcriptional activator